VSGKGRKFKQAPPSADLANAFGVEKYIPKNGKKDVRATCGWEIGCDARAVTQIQATPPPSSTLQGFSEKFCQAHSNVMQTKFFDFTMTVTKLKV
jgi:hypothetical protein